MKTPRPWYRKQNDTWYIIRDGKQISLCKGKDKKAEAEKVYFRLVAHDDRRVPDATKLTVAQVCDLFLEFSSRHHEPSSYEWYRAFQEDLCAHYGSLPALQLTPFHVSRWLDGHTGTDMVMRHYQHLRQRQEQLRNAAVRATRTNAS